jgi:putative ABC transport system permease protein
MIQPFKGRAPWKARVRVLVQLALASGWNRRTTLALTLVSLAFSVSMLLAVERTRQAVRDSFTQAVSGTDLVIGARTSPVQLILYSVFRLGEATSNMGWDSFQKIAAHPSVAWSIPLSLGDSHRGFPVLGTTSAYFGHFKYGDSIPLRLASGRAFDELFDVVLGAEVARNLKYKPGDSIVLSHGTGTIGLAEHRDKPFRVSGVLEPTGTPVDRTVHVSLEAIEAIHLNWQGGAPMPGISIPAEAVVKFDLTPTAITAGLIGLKTRAAVFQMQRHVNEFGEEPLLAVLPSIALNQLWRIMAVLERSLLFTSGVVIAISFAGMVAVMLAGLGERRRELAILRSVGAGPGDVILLLTFEGLMLSFAGSLIGYLFLTMLSLLASPILQSRFGLVLPLWHTLGNDAMLLGSVIGVGLLASLIPAWRASQVALADGLTPRL